MRVLIVSQYFDPEPVPIPSELATELTKRGHTIRVLTGFPNYPAGRIYAGFRQTWRTRSVEEGVEIVRVPLIADHSKRAWARIANYLSFALSASTARSASRDVDVVYVYATQMSAAFAPWLWRLTGGKPYVVHVQDLWPESIVGSSLVRSGVVVRTFTSLLNVWLRGVYRRAAGVIAIAPGMKKMLLERGVHPDRSSLIFNWATADALGADRNPMPDERDGRVTRVLYAGNVGDLQGLEHAVAAAVATADQGIRLRIVGNGVAKPELERLAADLSADNVEFCNAVPRADMDREYAAAHFGLVSLKNLPVFYGTVPSKYQSIVAHGLPVISTVPGDVHELTEAYGVGIVALPEDSTSLARAFRRAAMSNRQQREEMSHNARRLAREQFSMDRAVAKIEAELISAATDRKK